MQTVNAEKVAISKSLYNEIKKYYSAIFLDIEPYSKKDVMVKKAYILELINELKKEARITNIDFIRKISNVDKSNFESLCNSFEEARCKIKREEAESSIRQEDMDNLTEELITNGLKLKNEIERLKSFPALKKQISMMIAQIKKSETPQNIKELEEEFLKLCGRSAKYDYFEELSRDLSTIIGNTYKENITNIAELPMVGEFSVIACEDGENCFLLSKKNLLTSSFGLIIAPSIDKEKDIITDDLEKKSDEKSNIKFASNKTNEEVLLPFDKLDKNENYIEVYDLKPIAAYAVTLGEKSLSENYQQAQKLSIKYRNIPLIEIDLSKYISFSDSFEEFKHLIDQLLDDKNVNFSKKDEEFYKRFENFYREYKLLKTNAYDEGRIRNLFDHYIRLLSSQEVCDLSVLLKEYKYSDIETVLKYNTFMDDNIFRYKTISKPLLQRFIDKFYFYKDDKNLNKIYPGFNTVLSALKDRTDDELDQTAEDINQTGIIDSWLLAQTFDPIHSKITYINIESEENFKSFLDNSVRDKEDEREKLLSLKEYLSSLDEDKQQSIKIS